MANRVDANQADIVSALRVAGVKVHCTHMVGNGFPDLVCGRDGRTYLLEVKVPGKRLNSREATWHATWTGHKAVVHSIDEALAAVGLEVE